MTLRVFVAVVLALVVVSSIGAAIAILATGDESSEDPTIVVETAPETTR